MPTNITELNEYYIEGAVESWGVWFLTDRKESWENTFFPHMTICEISQVNLPSD